MQSDSLEENSLREAPYFLENGKNKLNNLSQVITEGSVAAAGINVDTPIVSAIIGNLTGKLPTRKKYAKQIKCKVCNCSVSSYIVLQKHINGAKHQRKLKHLEIFNKLKEEENKPIQKSQNNEPVFFMCKICPLEVNSAIQLQTHLSGERHKRKIDRLKKFQVGKNEVNRCGELDDKIQPGFTCEEKLRRNGRDLFTCSICNLFLNSKAQQNEHMNSKKHKSRMELRQKLRHALGKENPCINSSLSFISFTNTHNI